MEKVLVLLSTFNGEKYIEAQLQSLLTQKGVNVEILVRDDGSTDKTRSILDAWQKKGLLTWYSGSNLGPGKSFMDLLSKAQESDYYAFCDQDDVWLPNKLAVAVDKLMGHEQEVALYLSKTKLVDADLNEIDSHSNHYYYTFGESFLRNPATGCTMVFNHKLKNVVVSYQPSFLYMHDGWVYKICLMLNGFLYADQESYILYRQHQQNVVGGGRSFIKRWKRRYNVFVKRNAGVRYLTNKELYKGYSKIIPNENKQLMEACLHYKDSLWSKFHFVLNRSITTPHRSTKFYFVLACLLNKY